MSNLAQFLTIGKRLGEVVSLPYNGQTFTATDGTVWMATNDISIAYSSTYAALLTDARQMVSCATVINGPFTGNTWKQWSTRGIVGSTAGGATWLMMQGTGGSFIDFYYTSTDAGSTWTQRTPPVAAKTWFSLWDGTNFVIYAQGTGATGVQEATDGVTWTSRTAISIATIADFVFANSLYVCIPSGGTTLATSADRTTWTSRTCTTTASVTVTGSNIGIITWNAGAGLWIMGTSTNSTYQTSPDAITWTTRTPLNTTPGFLSFSSVRFASSATVTVAVGTRGQAAYTTNGTSWTLVNIDAGLDYSLAPQAAFHDGTNFVVIIQPGLVYYSSDGTAWTRAVGAGMVNSGGYMRVPGGYSQFNNGSLTEHQMITDATATTATRILYPGTAALDASPRNYVRIL